MAKDRVIKSSFMNLLQSENFGLIEVSIEEALLINGGDTGYYGTSPHSLLNNLEKNGKAFVNAVSTTVHHIGDFFRGFWDGVVK